MSSNHHYLLLPWSFIFKSICSLQVGKYVCDVSVVLCCVNVSYACNACSCVCACTRVCVCAHVCVHVRARVRRQIRARVFAHALCIWCMQIITTPIHARTILRCLPCMVCAVQLLTFPSLWLPRGLLSLSNWSGGGGEHLGDWGAPMCCIYAITAFLYCNEAIIGNTFLHGETHKWHTIKE